MSNDTKSASDYLEERLKDPEFRAAYERGKREIAIVDDLVNHLEALRDDKGLSKAMLARMIGKNPSAIRRLLTASGNPELRTVVALADALDADVIVVPRGDRARRGGADKSA